MKRLSPSLLSLALILSAMPMPAHQAMAQENGTPSTYNETRLASLEEQIRVLNGRVEQIEFAVRRLDQTLLRQQSDNDARLTKLEQAPTAVAAPPLPPTPLPPPVTISGNGGAPMSTAQNTAVQAELSPNGTLGALKMQDGRVTGGVNNPQAPALPVAPPDYGLTTEEQYDRAFTMLRQADYASAERAFKDFIDKNPKDKLVDNAKYWYAETLYVRAEFDAAAVAFADAYQQNPRGPKAPDSLLKLAMSLGALNKTQDACVTLGELKTKFPTAPSATKSRADDERARLKCPLH